MSAKLQPGDVVTCQYYNAPDGHYTGVYFQAQLLPDTDQPTDQPAREYTAKRLDDQRVITLHRKEILWRVKRQHRMFVTPNP